MSNPVLAREFEKPQPQYSDEVMTAEGVSRKTFILFSLLLAAAVVGWTQVDVGTPPSWMLPAILIALGALLIGVFKPEWSPIIGPIYAIVEGLVVGAISRVYQDFYGDGIVTNALMATGVVVLVMAILYATRTIRVTERMRSIVIGATAAIFVFYMASLLLSFFSVQMPLVWDAGPLGILFSLGVIVLAAFNLLLDFDLIERGIAARAPGYMNWYAAFGLMVTVVWLYLEILRLLAKLQRD
jgi:uncharacterized YccA/Bax inhibitor family protein